MSSFLDQINNKASESKENPEDNGNNLPQVEDDNAVDGADDTKNALGGIRSTEHETEVDRGFLKKRLITIIVVSVIACAVIAGVWFTAYTMRLITVGDFTGRTFAEMAKWAGECGLILDERDVFDEKISEGTVIIQSIDGGKKLPPKSVIEVTVSKGADPDHRIDVPDLTLMTAAEVRTWITDNQLAATKIIEENSDTVPKGGIIRYEFDSVSVTAETFRRGDGLSVYASKGKAVSTTAFRMPDLTGKAQTDIEAWATEKKVSATYKEVLSETVGKGKVVSQSVPKDTAMDAGASVAFDISAGAGIEIPDYRKYNEEEADSANTDLVVSKKSVYNTSVAYGRLISQSKSAGTKVLASDNNVELVYSLGAPYMPSLIGKSESELPELFYNFNTQGTNFNYTVKYVDSAETKGTVVWASKGNEYVSLTENIGVCVSNGKLVDAAVTEENIDD